MEPLDPELRRLIREGLEEARPTPAVEERVLQRLLQQLPGGSEFDGGGDNGGGGAGGADSAGRETITATTTGASRVAANLKTALVTALITAGAAAVTIAAVGDRRAPEPALHKAGVAHQGASSKKPTIESDAPESGARGVVAETAGLVEATDSGAAISSVADPQPSRRTPRRTPSSPAPMAPALDPLLDETRRIGEADAALARGEYHRARALAEELASIHPRGQLVLEREAIDLCARCGLGESEAGAAARAFIRAHAGAPVAAKVRARCAVVIKSIPE